MPTIKEICDGIHKGKDMSGRRGPKEALIPVTRGMTIREAPRKEGLVQLTPEQALSVIVERVAVNGAVDGYQRVQDIGRSWRIARDMKAGLDVPEISLALDSGKVYCDDGAHRLIAAVIAKKPIWAAIRKRNYNARAQRFASQQLARRVNADVLALANDSVVHRYIQAGVVARQNGLEHPWATLVGTRNSKLVMGPHTAVAALVAYTTSLRSGGGGLFRSIDEERLREAFTPEMGEQLSRILLTFGTKSTNPLAFRPMAVRAITDAAVSIIARTGRKESDLERWERHMSSFDWAGYAWIHNSRELSNVLIRHWNKRLGHENKISES